MGALIGTVGLGVGSIVERSVAVFTALKLIGAAYIVYLGVQAIREHGSLTEALAETSPDGGRRWAVGQGFLVGVTVATTGRKD
ncbi:LysE family transporter [Spirillospora sp. NPDC048911]|uniref:LysE family transporter n=1 Tax=Spirillospora sp. NPDC048911 TaxID=3364527 RepID=UPI00370FEEBB